MSAPWRSAGEGDLDTYKQVVPDLETLNKIKDRLGYTTLHYACKEGKMNIVEYCAKDLQLTDKAFLGLKAKYGSNPLDLASKANKTAIRKIFNIPEPVDEVDFDFDATMTPDEAATKVQSMIRGHQARKAVEEKKEAAAAEPAAEPSA